MRRLETVKHYNYSTGKKSTSVRGDCTPPDNDQCGLLSLSFCVPECRINGILQYRALSDWLLSPINMQIRTIHGFGLMVHSFLLQNIIWLFVRTMVCLSIHLSRISWLLSGLGDNEKSWCKYLCAGFCVEVSFQIGWVTITGIIAILHGMTVFRFALVSFS